MEDERLTTSFLSQLPEQLRDAATSPQLGAELSDLVARARREAPGIDLDLTAFLQHAAERITFDRHGHAIVAPLHAGALWIAFGCVISDRSALAAFETTYGAEITNALARSFDRGLAEDAELRLRERLFLVGTDDVPRLSSYSGRGPLHAWLRAAAVRTAIDLMRSRRTVAVDPGGFDELGAATDPVLAALKQRYRDEFKVAFDQASSTLTDREKTLLRYRFLDGLSIDEIAPLYRVHRATIARWLATTREALFEGTRVRLMSRFDLSEGEVDSVLRLIDSQLDVSVELAIR